ncbi:reverse transcriptase domain-containing protein [Tanacetum coccineum]
MLLRRVQRLPPSTNGKGIFFHYTLRGPKINYTSMEKLVLALVHANFIVKRLEEESSDTLMEVEEELPKPWILFTDGSSCTDGSGAGLILTNPEGIFKAFSMRQIPRSKNKKADALSKIASTSFAHLTDVKKARAVRRKSQLFAVINEILYRKSFLGPWLRCVGPIQVNYVLREIHEGSCSMHAGTLSVVAKALRIGYYWSTMHKDTRALIRACQDCQVHKPVPRNPHQKLTLITSPWPFYKWGIDIAGPFLEGPGKVKFLIAAMDYFTKWIEAKPVATITGNQIKKIVWDNITNGLVERANRSLGEGIKARLGVRNKKWMEELSHVLWAHRTMIKSSNRDTPFSLTYGTEAVIPAEIGMPTLRITEVDLVQNNEALEINLDLLEERREQAAIREAKIKARMEKYYNSKVKNTSFKLGDLVYRNNDASRTEDTGKLGPKWEGPYEVTKALGKGAYKLRDRDGKQLPRTSNVSNLKKCYIHKMQAIHPCGFRGGAMHFNLSYLSMVMSFKNL